MLSKDDRADLLRGSAKEDVEQAAIEMGLARRALEEGDVTQARRRLARLVGLATEAGSALLILQLFDPPTSVN
jgi:hypothetical protein